MRKLLTAVLSAVLGLMFATPLVAQGNGGYNDGLRRGYGGRHGGGYNDQYDQRRYHGRDDRNQGGIGPGKGALIGGAGGAVLGALFGGGLKGAIIGGGAGAGVGAIAGKVHQNNQRDDYRDGRYNR